MPELPEVHTTVEGLKKTILGKKIRAVSGDTRRMFKNIPIDEFESKVKNKKILAIERRAKNILIHLEGGLTIIIHLKMTGHLLYGLYEKVGSKWKVSEKEKNDALRDPFNRFVRVVFCLSDGNHLAFSDTRKFGSVSLFYTSKVQTESSLKKLGPEPLLKNFTYKVFKDQVQRRAKSKIKTVLMDQTIISGIGNIYSDEILIRAHVLPYRTVDSLKDDELKNIFKNVKPTLRKGINFGGDSMSDYRNVFGEKGKFQNKHLAYRRVGKPCLKKGCGGIIRRKVVNGRSAHYCDTHQR